MRLWILTQFYPPEFGAAAVRLSRLAHLLAQDGHQVTVLTGMPNYPEGVIKPPYRGRIAYREQRGGADIRRVWVYASPHKRTLPRLLNQFSFMLMAAVRGAFLPRPDVILVESHPLFIVLAAGWLKRVKRAPIVLNVSDLWPESAVATGALNADSPMVKIASRVEKWAYRDAAHIIAMTKGVRDGVLIVHPHPERTTLIQNAVDLDVFRPHRPDLRAETRARLGINPAQIVVTHVGNMSLTYNFDGILNAAAALPDLLFVFVGGGSQETAVREQAAARGLNNVRFTGVVPHADMPGLWAAADLTLIALGDHSVAGGTIPAKLYEAVATGTPVVAAIRGEGAAVIEHAGIGLTVPIGDSEAMRTAIRRLADSPDVRARMTATGRAYAEANLAAAAVKDRYAAVFQAVTDSPSKRTSS
ncbi:MAG: glycosyltransferase family 4 protein [bacterium]|nr:glycosyltransferase family 4 protein [bacterium]